MLEAQLFLERVLSAIDPYLKAHWEIDHLCFRTSSLEHYAATREVFEKTSALLIESEIGGRPIATYQQQGLIAARGRRVDVIEVPAPKPGRTIDKGFEHLEIVMDLDFTTLQQSVPHWKWDARSLGKDLNPELEARFDDFNIKFHHHALSHIINIEKHEGARDFLQESQLLSRFEKFSPLISGTIPLGIDTEKSDLDILFHVHDFEEFEQYVKSIFPDAKFYKHTDAWSANFQFKGLPVEFYASSCPPLQQNAHRHLRIEGRLLKLLGPKLRADIHRLKSEGVKTEMAFGEVLALSSPYDDLLKLYWLSDEELLQRFGAVYATTRP